MTLTFTLTVTDAGGASGTDTVAIRVWANNDAPTAAAGSDQTSERGRRRDPDRHGGRESGAERADLRLAADRGGRPTMTLTGGGHGHHDVHRPRS